MFLVNKYDVEGSDQPRSKKKLVGGGMLSDVGCDVCERRHVGDGGWDDEELTSFNRSNIVRSVLCGEVQLFPALPL